MNKPSVLDEIKRSAPGNVLSSDENWTPPPSIFTKLVVASRGKVAEVAAMEHGTLIVVMGIALVVLSVAYLRSYRRKRRAARTTDEKTAKSPH